MKKIKTACTSLLFSDTSFLIGAGSTLNIAGNYFDFNRSKEPDLIALSCDWRMVGSDLIWAMNEFDNNHFDDSQKDTGVLEKCV